MRIDPKSAKGALIPLSHVSPSTLGDALSQLRLRRQGRAVAEPLTAPESESVAGIRTRAREGTLGETAPLGVPARTASPDPLAKARDYHHLAQAAGLRALAAEASPKRWQLLCDLASILGVPRDSLAAALVDLASPTLKAQLREDLRPRASAGAKL